MSRLAIALCGVVALLSLPVTSAHAQATRTWVSGVGDDANPCSRTAPCKTFAGAISKTAARGEINVLDPGGYGAVTITKSISIYNEGVGEAGVLVSGTNGVVINAASTDVVNLRGLVLNGLNNSLSGVNILSAGRVNIENCVIQGFGNGGSNQAGILVNTGAITSQLHVQDTIITATSANGFGVLIQPATGGTVNATLENVRIVNNNGTGVKASGTGGGSVTLAISNSNISSNAGAGVNAVSGAGNNIKVHLTNDVVSTNAMAGVQSNASNGGTTSVTVGASLLSNDNGALSFIGGGSLVSYGNNQVAGPLGTGFSGSLALQ
jgi:hypothetical protein